MRPRSLALRVAALVVAGVTATAGLATPSAPAAAADDRAAAGSRVVGLIVTPTDPALPRGVVGDVEDLLDVDVSGATRTSQGAYALRLDSPVDAADAGRASTELAARADVATVEPDHLARTAAASPVTPADPYFSSQTWLWDSSAARAGGWSNRAPAFWKDRGRGSSSVVVAVVDTGITAHPDLDGSVVAGYDMVSDPATARDGGSRDANPLDEGDWMTTDEARLCEGDRRAKARSSSWHGTHVAGVVAARADNGLHVAGTAPGVRVQPVRVLGRCGGAESDVAAGITWASGGSVPGVPANRTPASVVSLSLGVQAPACGATMKAAIDGARRRGVVVVAAAGNEAADVRLSSPASCAGVVAVGASTRSGGLAAFSNRGRGLALSAPGTDVLSTIDNGTTTARAATVATMSGTSQAAPQVAAAAALVRSVDRTLPAARVEAAVRGAVQPYASATSGGGAGVLDLGRLMAARTVPQVRGGTTVGSTLTATPAQWVLGTFASRQWRRDGRVISGATGTTYRLTRADVGRRVSVTETARSGGYSSNPLSSGVVAVPAWSSSARLRASRATARYGRHAVRLRVVVAGRDGPPTGTVTVLDGRKALRTVRLSRGVATVTLGRRALRPGAHRLRAVYRPADATYRASTSATVTLRVKRR